jgi:hypothetical protein
VVRLNELQELPHGPWDKVLNPLRHAYVIHRSLVSSWLAASSVSYFSNPYRWTNLLY